MKPQTWKILLAVTVFGAASAAAQTPVPPQPTERGGSPYDRNPACADREVATTDPACVIRDGPPAVRFDFNSTTPLPVTPGQPQGNVPPSTVIVVPQGSTQP